MANKLISYDVEIITITLCAEWANVIVIQTI